MEKGFLHNIGYHLWLGILRLITFAWDHSLGNFCLVYFALELSRGIFRLGIFVWDPSLGTFAWELLLGFCRLGPLAWELSLVNFGLGNWAPEAGGIGLLRLGNRWQDHGGTLGAVFVCLVIKTTSKNPSG